MRIHPWICKTHPGLKSKIPGTGFTDPGADSDSDPPLDLQIQGWIDKIQGWIYSDPGVDSHQSRGVDFPNPGVDFVDPGVD